MGKLFYEFAESGKIGYGSEIGRKIGVECGFLDKWCYLSCFERCGKFGLVKRTVCNFHKERSEKVRARLEHEGGNDVDRRRFGGSMTLN